MPCREIPLLNFRSEKLLLTQAAHIFEGLSTFGQMDLQTLLIRIGLMAVGFS